MASNRAAIFNFDLCETADAIRETVTDFSTNETAPRAAEIDRSNTFPRDLWPKIGALACTASVEEEYGGSGPAISSTASRSRRFRGRRPRSGWPMAPFQISASTRSAATATRRRSANTCRS